MILGYTLVCDMRVTKKNIQLSLPNNQIITHMQVYTQTRTFPSGQKD